MRRCATFALLVVLAVGPAALRGQDEVTLKLKVAGKGDTLRVEKKSDEQSQTKLVTPDGKGSEDKQSAEARTSVYQETILAREGTARPTKLRRQYEKAQVTKDKKTTDLPYQGKTVIIEKKGDKYTFSLEGGKELPHEDATSLDREFNRGGEMDVERMLLPRGPVKVGASWKVDMEPIVKELEKGTELPMEVGKATGTGKLAKVYDKDGRKFGIMEFRLTIPLKAGKLDKVVIDGDSKVVVDLTLDACIDGSADSFTTVGNVNLDLKAAVPLGEKTEAKMTATVKAKMQEARTEQGKK